MNAHLILNARAGSADDATHLLDALRDPALRDNATITLHRTARAGHARELAAEAQAGGADLVIAVGGDGTINEVVNGLAPDFRATLGIVPLGTGNDLARTLAIAEDPGFALKLCFHGARRRLDLIRITNPAETVYGINVCAGGFTGEMNEVVDERLKASWGPLAYLIGAARALPELEGYHTAIRWEDGPLEPVDAFNVVVANGRTAAGGRPAAPWANPEDGLLDVVVVKNCSPVELAAFAALFLTGDYLDSPHVLYRRVRRVHVEAQPGMWFNVDGELHTQEPVTFETMPQAIEVVVGPSYTPEAARAARK